jgi:hypothetical protein
VTTLVLSLLAVTPAAVATLAAAVYIGGGALSARRRPVPGAVVALVAVGLADLDDYTWRAGQVHQAYAAEIEAARVDLAFERVYAPLRDRHPLTPRAPRAVDVISQWWAAPPPTVLIGAMP